MIQFEMHQFTAKDHTPIYYYTTPSNPSTKGVLILVHGMAEYAKRYQEFADFLLRNNIVVYAIDQRGHGQTGLASGHMGHFSNTDGWEKAVEDVRTLTMIAIKENPELPIFIFGHSMGSLITRTCLIKFGELFSGVVLCGTTMGGGLAKRKAGKALALLEIEKNGPTCPSKSLTTLTFGPYNRHFKPNHTPLDWLSVNAKNTESYLADPLCGLHCSARFYSDMLSNFDKINSISEMKKIPKDLPILLISGEQDPVGNMGKQVYQLYKKMQKAQLNASLCLIPGKRHEILNENNRLEVFQFITDFISANFG